MLGLSLDAPVRAPLRVLCIGAHPDDIEIGCGGTLLRLLSERPRVRVHWVVMTGSGIRAREARASANRVLRKAASSVVRIEQFPDGHLPYHGTALKSVFEQLKATKPHVVFTHFGGDAHQDHRMISELTWNTFRDHCILEYEIPKFDGDLGRPSVFVELSAAIRRQKVRLLMSAFPSQRGKRWFSESTFDGLMRLRGVECAASGGYAEAFYARKILLKA